MGIPPRLISILAVPPGTQAHRRFGGPGTDPKSGRKSEYDLISPPDEFLVCGLAALPARADVVTLQARIYKRTVELCNYTRAISNTCFTVPAVVMSSSHISLIMLN